jgi:hypothetical protein
MPKPPTTQPNPPIQPDQASTTTLSTLPQTQPIQPPKQLPQPNQAAPHKQPPKQTTRPNQSYKQPTQPQHPPLQKQPPKQPHQQLNQYHNNLGPPKQPNSIHINNKSFKFSLGGAELILSALRKGNSSQPWAISG